MPWVTARGVGGWRPARLPRPTPKNLACTPPRGAKKMLAARPEHDWSDGKSAWISALCALGVALLTAVIIVPILIARSKKFFDADGNSIPQPPTAREQRAAQRKLDAEAAETAAAKGRADGGNASAGEVLARLSAQQRSAGQEAKTSLGQAWRWIKHVTTQGMTTDIHHVRCRGCGQRWPAPPCAAACARPSPAPLPPSLAPTPFPLPSPRKGAAPGSASA